MKKGKRSPAVRCAYYGILVALAMILSYVEVLIPIPIGIPGIKLGLANLVVFTALYLMDARAAFVISMVRILLVSMTFGNSFALLYSFSGGLLSYAAMAVCKKLDLLSPVGVSITGGVTHNFAQLVVASFVLENRMVFTYFPVLLLAGTVTGALIGIVGSQCMKRLSKWSIN